ncbi:RnfABCDGE type electron transport complex subunit D [Natranaerobius trueperi]|uniref:Electron transporter RnfD n=1 Tax=Natranaerobius trueperi TaxID=759412 RepID=A0A226BXL3_9FIRM|nr:RnfABCDGE type electron transport complex subunit D [Natranaerobius trueperi]OWZ83675.1 electron transporter RnfD [Natranaerobius trueperi]
MSEPNLNMASPHLDSGIKLESAMRDIMLALVPVTLTSIYFYGAQAIFLILVSITSSVLTEIVAKKLKSEQITIQDGSAVLIGLFIGLLLSPFSSVWRAVFASVIAIGIAKELVGGLGWNYFNPALFGYVITLILARFFPFLASSDIKITSVDGISQATPLTMIQTQMDPPAIWELLLAYPGGALSETSALAVILGGVYLIYQKHINWRIPVSILATSFLLVLPFDVNPVYFILSGGLIMGAFFMATDWVTSPVNNKGMIIYGIGIGVLIVMFRMLLPPTGGVALAILIMNVLVPQIENVTKHPSLAEPKFDKFPG